MATEHLTTLIPSLLTQYRDTWGLRDLPVSVDRLRPMIEERGWVDRIIWEEFDFESRHIFAQVEFFRGTLGAYSGDGDHARVRLSSSLNLCWRRFSVVKEMFHAVIDQNPETRVCTVEGLLQLGEMLVSSSSAGVQTFAPLETETTAVILAVEMLFPFEVRSRYEQQYREGIISDHQLALRFRIPELYVTRAMLPSYYEAIRRIRAGTFIDF